MPQLENFQPTPLMERLRTGEDYKNDPALLSASNLSFFIQMRIYKEIEAYWNNSLREPSTSQLSPEERAEIALTGLQLAYEAGVVALDGFVERAEEA